MNSVRYFVLLISSLMVISCSKKIKTLHYTSLEEIEAVAAHGVQINIDNLSILEQFGTKHPKKSLKMGIGSIFHYVCPSSVFAVDRVVNYDVRIGEPFAK